MRLCVDAYFAAAGALLLMPMPMRELNANFDADARILCEHRMRISPANLA